MIDLSRYFRILFLNKNISRANLKQFTEDHIQRLIANNPGGIFTSLITTVTNAYTAFFGDMSDVSIADAALQARTAGMNAAKDNVIKFIRDAHGLITYTFRNSTETIQEFYPYGLNEYNQSDLGNFETLMNRFGTAIANNIGSLPAGFDTDYAAVVAVFTSNRTSQLATKATLGGERSEIAGTHLTLCTELTRSVLTIALQFVGDMTKASVYFDQSIIDPDHTDKVLLEVTVNIPAGATVNVPYSGFQMKGNYQIIAVNPATSSVASISFGPDPNTLANPKTMDAGFTYSGSATDTEFSTTNTFLNLRSETDQPATVTVKVMKLV